jgi:REP element-mobilizing transposase RayT
MPQSLAKVILHTVFSTKGRAAYLSPEPIRVELYSYLATVLKSLDSPAVVIGGMADHVHVLHLLSRTHAIAEVVEEIKTASSKWIKTKGEQFRDFHWQNGYGVFSVSESKLSDVRAYIGNQAEHHQKMSFQDEFRELCRRHGVAMDEKYVWD